MLVCPVCKVKYATSGDHQPRLLISCGHTFCQKCLDERRGSDNSGITCPQCNLVSTDPHVPNFIIMSYLDAISLKPEETARHPLPPPQKSLCQNCRKELASVVCFQCLATGFMFCASCSEIEHSRPFEPLREHQPRPIETVRISTPVPMCKVHQNQPCLFFSSKVNKFACESCKTSGSCPEEDEYVPIDEAVEQVRKDVPSLVQLIREKVNTVVQTRANLDVLLKRVDQEKVRAMDLVSMEFNAFEVALKKRLTEVIGLIEEETHFQKKSLLSQQKRLELAQGNADRAIVRGDWLLQMADYNHLYQADNTLSNMRAQLSDEDLPLYRIPVTSGEIPVYTPPDLLERIKTLGRIGGGKVPIRLITEIDCGLLLLKWEQADAEAKEYEIRYEPVEEEDTDPLAMVTGDYSQYMLNFPRSLKVPATATQQRISGIMPKKKYCFRIRSLNIAGWGIWSSPVVGAMPGFPLQIEYTGEIVEVEIPMNGQYHITARGAKAADGEIKTGGRGAIIGATFKLKKYDKLIILCGGMSKKIYSCTGGGGGTFVAKNQRSDCLVVAGGGGGTRGYDAEDYDGRDANFESDYGFDGVGAQWAAGGAGGGEGKDAKYAGHQCWGYGGAGFDTASTMSKSFLHGGEAGEGGGFGGGGAVVLYGGGGGGGYSGGGGGRGGGGGGSYIRRDGTNNERSLGNCNHGSVTITHVDNGSA